MVSTSARTVGASARPRRAPRPHPFVTSRATMRLTAPSRCAGSRAWSTPPSRLSRPASSRAVHAPVNVRPLRGRAPRHLEPRPDQAPLARDELASHQRLLPSPAPDDCCQLPLRRPPALGGLARLQTTTRGSLRLRSPASTPPPSAGFVLAPLASHLGGKPWSRSSPPTPTGVRGQSRVTRGGMRRFQRRPGTWSPPTGSKFRAASSVPAYSGAKQRGGSPRSPAPPSTAGSSHRHAPLKHTRQPPPVDPASRPSVLSHPAASVGMLDPTRSDC